MSDRRRKSPGQRGFEDFCERYVSFWMFVCLAAFFFLGWPVLLSWAGLAWGMYFFVKILFGSESPDREKRKKR